MRGGLLANVRGEMVGGLQERAQAFALHGAVDGGGRKRLVVAQSHERIEAHRRMTQNSSGMPRVALGCAVHGGGVMGAGRAGTPVAIAEEAEQCMVLQMTQGAHGPCRVALRGRGERACALQHPGIVGGWCFGGARVGRVRESRGEFGNRGGRSRRRLEPIGEQLGDGRHESGFAEHGLFGIGCFRGAWRRSRRRGRVQFVGQRLRALRDPSPDACLGTGRSGSAMAPGRWLSLGQRARRQRIDGRARIAGGYGHADGGGPHETPEAFEQPVARLRRRPFPRVVAGALAFAQRAGRGLGGICRARAGGQPR
ncbi:hypothetical protein FNF07_14435 [Trinickia caryophylli]|uniref:hypothetical protein n=1 Tax=Trinickia caryophylli TaxID=28094 RepID=UPI00117C8AA8|nr:hypothetical protein [Trinickia caryophylli]TRX19306.1 hypothetical protein FNF07_14435 [Trinickia caryophylli]